VILLLVLDHCVSQDYASLDELFVKYWDTYLSKRMIELMEPESRVHMLCIERTEYEYGFL